MNNKIYKLNLQEINRPLNFRIGDIVRVYYKIVETNKTRTQVFEGLVIAIQNKLRSKTFTVRRISFNVSVEKIFPLYSPHIEKIVVISNSKVRRSKLYYMRDKFGKKSKLKEVKRSKKYNDNIYKKALEAQNSLPKDNHSNAELDAKDTEKKPLKNTELDNNKPS